MGESRTNISKRELHEMMSTLTTKRLRALLPVLFLCFCSVGAIAPAQQEQDISGALKAYPDDAKQIVDRLATLSYLPAEQWKYHPGDVPHGEAVDLDDSDWQTIESKAVTSTGSIWLRRWIEVPETLNGYDLTGARVWFQLLAGADGPVPEIVYFNGRRVALGDNLEPIILFDDARRGDKILVAVKLLHTADKKEFVAARLKIEAAKNRPSPGTLCSELISSAILIPAISKNPAGDEKILERAINSVDLHALDAGNQEGFDVSLVKARDQLEAIKPVLQQATLHLTGNSHIDAAWLWPWTETVDSVKRTFSTALQLMYEYPSYTFTQSTAAYSAWIAEKYPDINSEIRDRIHEGRWEIVGGMWVEPDLNMPDGESLVRQLLVGTRYFKQQYGVTTRVGWNPDSFGYNWQLPQIYKRSGIDYFVTQKLIYNDTNPLPLKLFWWQSPDGSRVLTYFPHDYVNDIEPVRMAQDFVIAAGRNPGTQEMLHLYGIGDHGGGPTRFMLDSGLQWSGKDVIYPKIDFGSAQSFFSEIETKVDTAHAPVWNYETMAAHGAMLPPPPAGKISLPVWNDELYFEYHRGVMTTQANHKRNMRDSEEWMLNAEKYASLAWLRGRPYPAEELTQAWEKVLFNQFHDLAAGSGIGAIYVDAQHDYDQVRWATEEIDESALKTLTAEVNTRAAGPVPIVVFNPLGWPRSGLVTVDVQMPEAAPDGVSVIDAVNKPALSEVLASNPRTNSFRLLVEVNNVPSLGYTVLHVVPGALAAASDLKVDGLTIENANLRVKIDKKTGCITSLFDKRTDFETLAAGACGNELQAFQDTPKAYDAWNIDPGTLDKAPALLDKADSVELVDRGPLRAAVRIVRHWQNSTFVQEIILAAGSDEVEVSNDIDWHETHVLLKAAFPVAAYGPEATYEIPYGTIDRPTTRNNSWERAKFEVPALRWADVGNGEHGFSLINNSKYGYDCRDNVLRLSLLRSPVWPDPNADRGHHHFTYAVYPHGGNWKRALTVRRGYEYNYKLTARQVESHTGVLALQHSYVSVSPENVVLTAVKKAEDSNALIFRVFEWAGKESTVEIDLPPGATGATLTNLMEKPEGSPLGIVHDRVAAPIHPYEILTIRADYPREGQTD